MTIDDLLRDYSFIPYRGYPGLEARQAVAEFIEATSRVDNRIEETDGLLLWSPQPFDSELLDWSCARVDFIIAADHGAARRLLERFMARANEREVLYVTARVPAGDFVAIHALEEAGFVTLDSVVTLVRSTSTGAQIFPPAVRCRLGASSDADAAAQLARRAYTVDRFHSDPLIPSERADAVFERWLRNSFDGPQADAVVIAEDVDGLAGFVTCKVLGGWGDRLGTIPLVAADRPGRGVGSAMISLAVRWFSERGVTAVEVGTQLANPSAIRFYERCGFGTASTSITLRRWMGHGTS